jgi:penicillin-binding protein 1C
MHVPRARLVIGSLALVTAAVGVALAEWIARPLPSLMTARALASGITIEDRYGTTLRSTRAADGSQAQWVSFDQLDPDVINAFVAVEDARFSTHAGVDGRAIARAVRDNLLAGHIVSGASTITMQLARVMRPARRDWGGKVTQALWALRIERHLSKQQVLEQYFNRVQLGHATVGVGAASALYFDASATELGVGQAATLAGLAHAPSRDNPLTSPKRAARRRSYALRQMQRLGYVSREEEARALLEPLHATPRVAPFLAPHFTTRVLAWTSGHGASPASASSVRTSLDGELQAAVEGEVRYTVEMLKTRGVEHAAAVVLDNATGEVLAWVGSPNFWAADDGQTDMVISERQPGSALKPFLYGLALDRGVTAASILPDIPKGYATATGSYSPRNYDRRFRGPVRAREALASSYNVPAVELASRMGTSSLLHTLHLAGFESLRQDAEHYGLGLALGNGDVTLLELANGYRALAMGGEWRPWSWRPVMRGSTLGTPRRVVSRVASAILLDMLSDPSARIPGFGTSTPFDFPFPTAVKTGTSRHFTDNWAVATTHGFTVAVWAGNFSGRPMQGVSGVTGAGPLLHRVVMETARRVAPGALTTPAEAGALGVPVCRLSGLRATPACAQLTEWFVAGTEPAATDDWEQGGRITLPAEYAEWSRQELRPVTVSISPAPAGKVRDDDRTVAHFRIVSPLDGDRYAIPPGIEARYATISLRAGGVGAERVRWSIDGAAHDGGRWPLSVGAHLLRAVSSRGESAEARIVVER